MLIFKYLALRKRLPALTEMVYDRAAILFSTKKIDKTEINLKPDELEKIQYTIGSGLVEIRVVIKPVTEGYQVCFSKLIKILISV